MRIEGFTSNLNHSWTFFARFAFSTHGTESGSLRISAVSFLTGTRVLFYQDKSWFDVYPPAGRSCSELFSSATGSIDIPIGQANSISDFPVMEANIRSNPPEFWFMTLARCSEFVEQSESYLEALAVSRGSSCFERTNLTEASAGLVAYYSIEATNPGGYFRRHFSADEHGLFELRIALVAFYALFGGAVLRLMVKRRVGEFLGSKLQLCFFATTCSLVSNVLYVVRCSLYAESGIERPSLLASASVFEAFSGTVLVVLLLLLSKGWGVTRFQMKLQTRILQALAIVLVALTHAVALSMAGLLRDDASSYTRWEDPIQWPSFIMRALLLVWFVVAVCQRLKKHVRASRDVASRLRSRISALPYSTRAHSAASRLSPLARCVQVRKVHQTFFRVLGVVGSLWLVTPMLCLGLCSVTAPASRQVVLETITEAVNAIALVSIACIALPTTMVPYMQVNPTVERQERVEVRQGKSDGSAMGCDQGQSEGMEVRRPPPPPSETSRQTMKRAQGIELDACSSAVPCSLSQEASSAQAQLSPIAVDAPGCVFASRASHPMRPPLESGGDDDSDDENAAASVSYPLPGVAKLKKSSIVMSR